MGTGISLFIHLKMGVVPPLFIQCASLRVYVTRRSACSPGPAVMAPIQTGQNALVRLYLLGDRSAELVNRPWKEPPSPFAAYAAAAGRLSVALTRPQPDGSAACREQCCPR